MINLKEELGTKYIDIEKCGVAEDLENVINSDALIKLPIESIKKISKGKIVGTISTTISNLKKNLKMEKINDEITTDCILNIECSNDGLNHVDKIISNIKKIRNSNMFILIGIIINDELKDNFKILALFFNNEKSQINTNIQKKKSPSFSNENELLYSVVSFMLDNDTSIYSLREYFGFNFVRIVNIIKILEKLGIISKQDNINSRKVLINDKTKIKELINHSSSSKVITFITVKGLFGFHSYKLIFNKKEPIAIIYGTNGMGKTTIFKMLNSLLIEYPYDYYEKFNSKNYDNFRYLCDEIPFEEFLIDFADESRIEVLKKENTIYINYLRKKGISFSSLFDGLRISTSDKNFKDSVKEHYNLINELFLNLDGKKRFLFINTSRDGTLVRIAKKIDDISRMISLKYLSNYNSPQNEYSKMLDDIFLIEKIINIESTVDLQSVPKKMNEYLFLICDGYEAYQTCFEISNSRISHDKDMPILIYDDNYEKLLYLKNNTLTKEKIKNLKYEIDYSKIPNDTDLLFCSYDGWDDGGGMSANQITDVVNNNINELYNYLINFEIFKKAVEDFYNKYDPSYKKIILTLNDSPKLLFECSNGKIIDESHLSSGEVNLISILYSIAFNTSQDTIVLIDEPEISLHMLWVQQLTSTILKMIKSKKNMQVILSSHSPFLAAGHEEYLVEGKLLEEGE